MACFSASITIAVSFAVPLFSFVVMSLAATSTLRSSRWFLVCMSILSFSDSDHFVISLPTSLEANAETIGSFALAEISQAVGPWCVQILFMFLFDDGSIAVVLLLYFDMESPHRPRGIAAALRVPVVVAVCVWPLSSQPEAGGQRPSV